MNSLHNEEIDFTLPIINNTNSNKNLHFVQKVFQENKVVNKKLIMDTVYSPFRKFEYLKENQILRVNEKSFSLVNNNKLKNNKIYEDIENMIESFKKKDYQDLKSSIGSGDSLLNTFRNFVNYLKNKKLEKSENGATASLGRINRTKFLTNLIKSEKVYKIIILEKIRKIWTQKKNTIYKEKYFT
jgi:hypothetical protein